MHLISLLLTMILRRLGRVGEWVGEPHFKSREDMQKRINGRTKTLSLEKPACKGWPLAGTRELDAVGVPSIP